jgi:hypothetical protein
MDEIQLKFWAKYRTTEETGYDTLTEWLVNRLARIRINCRTKGRSNQGRPQKRLRDV